MFTGIIESVGKVVAVETSGTNRSFWIESPISPELKIDQSLSHEGVCLTVEQVAGNRHKVTAIRETLAKTTLGSWQEGDQVNLERAMLINSRLDGHFVQGHVDATVECTARQEMDGSWQYTLDFDPHFAHLLVEKGSVCLNGTSLTVFNVTASRFTVAIIPFTYHHTSINRLQAGDFANVEFDMLGKYIARMAELRSI